jgi:uncharacterized protein YbaR (Trm112 family)
MSEDKEKSVDPRLLEVLVCPVTKSTLFFASFSQASP